LDTTCAFCYCVTDCTVVLPANIKSKYLESYDAIRYGLDGPGSNLGGGDILRTDPDHPWGPPSLLYSGYWVISGGKAIGAWL